jgi:hypothetical protein
VTATDILRRRLRVFELSNLNLSSEEIHVLLRKEGFDCSEETIRRDIRELPKLLPELVNLREETTAVAAEILAKLRVAQVKYFSLVETTTNDSVRVGALKGAVDALVREAELRMKVGVLKAVPERFEVKQDVDVKNVGYEEAVREYGDAIRDEIIRRRLQGDRGDSRADTEQPVDSEETPP